MLTILSWCSFLVVGHIGGPNAVNRNSGIVKYPIFLPVEFHYAEIFNQFLKIKINFFYCLLKTKNIAGSP